MLWTIEAVEDTRNWDLESGKAIPGTGDMKPCDHCNHSHEIHVTIKCGNQRMSVGSTCAKKLAYDANSRLNAKSLLANAIYSRNHAIAVSLVKETPSGLTSHQINRWIDSKTDSHAVKLIYFTVLRSGAGMATR